MTDQLVAMTVYVKIHSGYDHSNPFTRDVWNYKRAIHDLTKSKIKEVNWYELINNIIIF